MPWVKLDSQAVELLHSYNLARQDGYIVISGPGWSVKLTFPGYLDDGIVS